MRKIRKHFEDWLDAILPWVGVAAFFLVFMLLGKLFQWVNSW